SGNAHTSRSRITVQPENTAANSSTLRVLLFFHRSSFLRGTSRSRRSTIERAPVFIAPELNMTSPAYRPLRGWRLESACDSAAKALQKLLVLPTTLRTSKCKGERKSDPNCRDQSALIGKL